MLRKIFAHDLAIPILIYGAGDAIRRVVPLLLLPVFTYYLSPDSYGELSIFNIYVALMTTLLSAGCIGAVGREYFDRTGNDFGNYVAHCLMLVLCLSLTAFAALYGPRRLCSNVSWHACSSALCRCVYCLQQ